MGLSTHNLHRFFIAFLPFLSLCLPQLCWAIPDNVPNHLITDNCTASNVEFYSQQPPGSFYYYMGTPDTYCNTKIFSIPSTSPGAKICGASSAPACTTAIAPYGTKTEACNADGYATCRSSVRVFFINYDLDCDWVIVCEYFDGPAVVVTTPAPGSLTPPAPKTPGTPPSVSAPPAVAPAPLLPPSPSLLPKAGDVVITSAYAVGTVQYFCDKASGLFSNQSIISASLYSTPLGNATVGSYQKANGSQVFSLVDGSRAVAGSRDTGASYAQNPNVLLDGGYGSLNQSYTTASGNASLTTVAYITVTATVGGILPSKAPCIKAPGSQVAYPPWSIPFEANITFLSKFTPPA